MAAGPRNVLHGRGQPQWGQRTARRYRREKTGVRKRKRAKSPCLIHGCTGALRTTNNHKRMPRTERRATARERKNQIRKDFFLSCLIKITTSHNRFRRLFEDCRCPPVLIGAAAGEGIRPPQRDLGQGEVVGAGGTVDLRPGMEHGAEGNPALADGTHGEREIAVAAHIKS